MSAGRGPVIMVQIATRARTASPARLRRWTRAALPAAAEVTVRVVGEREGRSLNRDYRGKDYATNVLSFTYSARPRSRPARPLSGDIVLCAPVIAREAREQGKHLDAHYAHMTVHGVLHLCGYRHGSRSEAQRMESRERTILRRLGYADPYRDALESAERREVPRQPSMRPSRP